MKLFYRNLPFAFSSIFFGFANLLIYFNLIEIEQAQLIAFSLIYFGIYLVYQEIDKERRGLIVVGVFSFFSGVLIFVNNYYRLLSFNKTIFYANQFVLAVIFFFLFINSNKNKMFFHLAVFFIIISLLSVYFIQIIPFYDTIILINNLIVQRWYLVVGIIGVVLIARRNDI